MVFAAIIFLMFGFLASGCLNGYDELELAEFKFVEGEHSDEEIEEGYEYSPDEEVFMYLEVEGFEADDGVINGAVSVTVRSPDGDIYSGLDNFTIARENTDIDADWGIVEFRPDRMFIDPVIGPERWQEGENEIAFRVIDYVRDEELTFTESFEVA